MAKEKCDRCKKLVEVVEARKCRDRVYTLCWDCMRRYEELETQVLVLQGWVEEIDRLTEVVRDFGHLD